MIEFVGMGRLFRMCMKELRETMRDRRTIVTLVLMPLLVYPILSMALQRLILNSAPGDNQIRTYLVGVKTEKDFEVLGQIVAAATRLVASNSYRPFRIEEVQQSDPQINKPAAVSRNEIEWRVLVLDEIQDPNSEFEGRESSALKSTDADLIVHVESTVEGINNDPGKALDSSASDSSLLQADAYSQSTRFNIEYRKGDNRSEDALFALRNLFQTINDDFALALREKHGLSRNAPVEFVANSQKAKSDFLASIAAVIPLVLVLMTITGAVYPAIDLTAGERERGTMEALIATPVPRFALLLSKYAAVLMVAVLTAAANLSAMYVTMRIGGLGEALLGKGGFPISVIFKILPLLIIFSAFFSAVLLALCCVAKSFKEAQAYLIPVMLLSMGPAVLSLLPNIHLTPNMAVVPIVNMILLARDSLSNQAQWLTGGIAIFSTLLYAAGMMIIASKAFGHQAVPQHSDISWRGWIRPSEQFNREPTLDHLFVFLAVFFPVFYLVVNLTGGLTDVPLESRIWINAFTTFVLFVGTIYAFMRWRGIGLNHILGSGHGMAVAKTLPGLLLLSISVWTIAHEILVFSSYIGLASLDLSRWEGLSKAKDAFLALPLWSVWIAMAILVAIAEEFFFRGFILQSLDVKRRPLVAVLISSILFGSFHTVSANVLAVERFLPTFSLGLLLGWIAWRSGSILPGMIVHALHNGLLFTMPHYEEWIGHWGLNVQEQQHLPITWIATGALLSILGVVWIGWVTTRKHPRDV